jgi:hypothetical protein
MLHRFTNHRDRTVITHTTADHEEQNQQLNNKSKSEAILVTGLGGL